MDAGPLQSAVKPLTKALQISALGKESEHFMRIVKAAPNPRPVIHCSEGKALGAFFCVHLVVLWPLGPFVVRF